VQYASPSAFVNNTPFNVLPTPFVDSSPFRHLSSAPSPFFNLVDNDLGVRQEAGPSQQRGNASMSTSQQQGRAKGSGPGKPSKSEKALAAARAAENRARIRSAGRREKAKWMPLDYGDFLLKVAAPSSPSSRPPSLRRRSPSPLRPTVIRSDEDIISWRGEVRAARPPTPPEEQRTSDRGSRQQQSLHDQGQRCSFGVSASRFGTDRSGTRQVGGDRRGGSP
jgi:hypothetical protein